MLALLEHSDLAAIDGLVVDEDERSAGIGAELVAAGEAWARERGATAMTVRSRSTRERAHRFYERRATSRSSAVTSSASHSSERPATAASAYTFVRPRRTLP